MLLSRAIAHVESANFPVAYCGLKIITSLSLRFPDFQRQNIWYYQIPAPEGRKKYTKTKPMQTDEFSSCLNWWQQREENKYAWKVSAEEVLKYDNTKQLISVNLDIKNPHSIEILDHRPPQELAQSILSKEIKIINIMKEINGLIDA